MLEKLTTTRRRFLQRLGITALASQIPGNFYLSANTTSNGFNLENLDQEIVASVKKLVKSRDVTLSILQPKGSLGNVKPVGDLFSEHTGVQIKYIEASLDEINTKIMAQTLSNQTHFDIALPATFGLPDLIEAGVIQNLDEYAAYYEPANLNEGMLYPIGDYYKGKFYGYQTDGDTYLIFYNKAWLEDEVEKKNFAEEFGYPLAIPNTWQQLDQMICFFQRPEENKYGGALYRNKDYIAWEWWTRFHAKGCFPFDSNLNPQINAAQGVDALIELIQTTKYLYPASKTNGLFENWEAFAQGNIFCNIGWGGTQKYLNSSKSKIRDHLAFGPTPGGYVNGKLLNTPYFNWGWNYTVSSFSKEPELAYLFTLYACSPKMSTIAVQFPEGYFDPFRVEHYQDEKIQQTYTHEFLDAHQFSMENSIPDLYLTGQGDYWDALKENLDLANRGKLTPKLALDATARTWNQVSNQLGKQSQIEQWNFLKNQYPESIRSLLS